MGQLSLVVACNTADQSELFRRAEANNGSELSREQYRAIQLYPLVIFVRFNAVEI